MVTSTNNYINDDDMRRILSAIPSLKIRKWQDHDIKFLFKIAYQCALRMGEACRLKKEDFNLQNREINLGKTKTHLNDKAVIPKLFVSELQIYLNYKDSGRLFPGLRVNTVRPWIIKLGEQLDIEAWQAPQSLTGEKTKSHIFRKSRAKDLLYEKKPLNIVQKVLRHENLDTTSKYLKADTEAVKELI